MSAASGSFGAKAGYNQSGGGYYIATGDLQDYANFVVGAQTGSGGASAPAQLSTANTSGALLIGLNGNGPVSTLLNSGNVIRDMGKTIVSSTRVFRKFQAVAPRAISTGGVVGGVGGLAGPTDTGYLDFYLEVTQGGAPGSGLTSAAPPIARTYF